MLHRGKSSLFLFISILLHTIHQHSCTGAYGDVGVVPEADDGDLWSDRLADAVPLHLIEIDHDGSIQDHRITHAKHSAYEEKYENAVNDPDTYIETAYTSSWGPNIARVSASLSTISSILIIYIIMRSNLGYTTYHRIMLMLSTGDIFASAAMAFATLPMPRDMIYTQFQTGGYGSQLTCNIQGFLFFFGTNFAFGSNASLCFYYFASITLKWKEEFIKKRVEPWLHTFVVLFALPTAILAFFIHQYNPTPFDAWCTTISVPWQCHYLDNKDEKMECMLNGEHFTLMTVTFSVVYIGFFIGLIFLVFSMISICISVYRQERLLQMYLTRIYRYRKQNTPSTQARSPSPQAINNRNLVLSRSRHHYTKIILVQAFAYLLAFLLCQSNVFISMTSVFNGNIEDLRNHQSFQIYHLIFRPLQGFLNLIVFLGHKIYNIRQVNKDLTIWKAFKQILLTTEEPKFIFSQVSIVNAEGGEEEKYFDGSYSEDDTDPGVSYLPFPKRGAIQLEDDSFISYGETVDKPEESKTSIRSRLDGEDESSNTDLRDVDLSVTVSPEDPFEDDRTSKKEVRWGPTFNHNYSTKEDSSSAGYLSSVFSFSSRKSDLSSMGNSRKE